MIFAFAVLGSAVWLVYGGSLHAPFVFDDRQSIVDNYSITTLWPPWGDGELPGPLTPPHDISTAGRPLVNLSLALNYHFGHLDPTGYHALNMVLHVLAALLVCTIVRRTLRLAYFAGRFDHVAEVLALVAAIIWTVHPLQTETVEYVTQRTELLVGLFYLATLYGSLRYWEAATSRTAPVGLPRQLPRVSWEWRAKR